MRAQVTATEILLILQHHMLLTSAAVQRILHHPFRLDKDTRYSYCNSSDPTASHVPTSAAVQRILHHPYALVSCNIRMCFERALDESLHILSSRDQFSGEREDVARLASKFL